jgi:hypothetical protein
MPVGNEQATQPVVIVVLLGLDEAARVATKVATKAATKVATKVATKAAAKAVAGRVVVATVDVQAVAIKVAEAGTIAVEIDETETKEPIRTPHHAVQ